MLVSHILNSHHLCFTGWMWWSILKYWNNNTRLILTTRLYTFTCVDGWRRWMNMYHKHETCYYIICFFHFNYGWNTYHYGGFFSRKDCDYVNLFNLSLSHNLNICEEMHSKCITIYIYIYIYVQAMSSILSDTIMCCNQHIWWTRHAWSFYNHDIFHRIKIEWQKSLKILKE